MRETVYIEGIHIEYNRHFNENVKTNPSSFPPTKLVLSDEDEVAAADTMRGCIFSTITTFPVNDCSKL